MDNNAYKFVIVADLAVKFSPCTDYVSHKQVAGCEKAIAAGTIFVADNVWELTSTHSDSLGLTKCEPWHINVLRDRLKGVGVTEKQKEQKV